MSAMQINWYRKILEKDIDAVNGAGGKKESKTRLLNIVMQLRKCCNHPYLFEGAEPGPPYTTDEHLVDNAAKMVMLDKLMRRFEANGDRVLIFSQMSRVLDILEDYSVMRGFQYCRIDGSTAHEDRIAAIDDYNKEGSEKFLFLLTTRAGGLGINLTSANVVILFDSDWNPQADLQAMDRAHRIGQKKQVYVYRFITENAIEEKVLERAAQKLRLDQLVIQQGRAQQPAKGGGSKDELLSMIQHGAEKVFQEGAAAAAAEINDDDIDAILRHGEERTAELNSKYEKLGLDELQNFKSESAYEWNGESFIPSKVNVGLNWINPSKRERKEQSYSMDKYYRQALQTGGRTAETRQRVPRAPKQVLIHDYQFFPDGLQELFDKETAWYRKENNMQAPLPEGTDEEIEQRKADQEAAQAEIDSAEPLTEEEVTLKEKLISQGFPDWNRRDFQQFINGSAKYGRNNYEGISDEVDGKTTSEIKDYAKVFWKKFRTIQGWERHIGVVEEGEARTRKTEEQKRLLALKLKQYRNPLQQMKINYTVSTTNKKVYSEEEDRFLLVKLNEHGVDSPGIYEQLREDIRDSRLFRFDWFFLSRTPLEISRRCATLLTTVTREFDGGDGRIANGKKRVKEEEEVEEQEEDEPAKKKTKGGAKVSTSALVHAIVRDLELNRVQNKQLANVKKEGKTASGSTSRAESVVSNGSAATVPTKSKAKGRKR
jgi:SWI/SNF-related matrix-associated actin-dependent regulator of chromatin subfamily A member 5